MSKNVMHMGFTPDLCIGKTIVDVDYKTGKYDHIDDCYFVFSDGTRAQLCGCENGNLVWVTMSPTSKVSYGVRPTDTVSCTALLGLPFLPIGIALIIFVIVLVTYAIWMDWPNIVNEWRYRRGK